MKGLILDRDGTLIAHVPYLADPAQVALLPGVHDGLRVALDAGLALFLHSNQSGVGRGYYPLAAVEACNRRMIELLNLGEQPFARICIAPEAPDQPSRYRKPSPAFLREILAEHGWRADELCCIGDRALDLQVAAHTGARAIGVATGLENLQAEMTAAGLQGVFPVFDRFDAAIQHVLSLT
ncbi:D-glycero-alpha-D-manno-heptose-1,7-bisphosphate 7-phosphatase [Opitutus terrae]|uniref:D-glycero-alpha-D-manno-heptose-1,7-bisphosphate 7-phosphatase n=1 Tax=Opitutus terrae TaxID=107709 RepID=UPI0002EC71F3|nr:HAD-IIIA family hydrolase [Opitutus terrae]